MKDPIERQDAIDAINAIPDGNWSSKRYVTAIKELPPAQPERDIPVKPIEITDMAWGVPHRQAVCPKCDYYLGHMVFFGDGKGKRITYCDNCGQAIDWEGEG